MIENDSHFLKSLRQGSLLLTLVTLPLFTSQAATWKERVPLIEKKLTEALQSYQKGDLKNAKKFCADAYFGVFEAIDANMEVAIRSSLSLQRAAELEEKFGDIRKSMVASQPLGEIQKLVAHLSAELQQSATHLDQARVKIK